MAYYIQGVGFVVPPEIAPPVLPPLDPIEETYLDVGDLSQLCAHERCAARFFPNERRFCCRNGKVMLPLPPPIPEPLFTFLTRNDAVGKSFRRNIRILNSLFTLTSTGMKMRQNNIGSKYFEFHLFIFHTDINYF